MSADELVALLDPGTGAVVGAAPRRRVRADNLPHSATGVVVQRAGGEVLVHRRSATKDLWPGLIDCAFGGVLLVGEFPLAGARRELAEEAGIDDPALVLEPLLTAWYRDEATHYLAHVYGVTWDGPVSFTDGEVEAAWWEPPDAVRAVLADPSSPLVPDTRALLTSAGFPI